MRKRRRPEARYGRFDDRHRKKWLVTLASTYLGVCLAGGAYIMDRALERPRRPVAQTDLTQAEVLARGWGSNLEAVSIEARDGETLEGWLFSPRQPNPPSVLLIHAVASNRAGMLAAGRLFVEHGYRTLLVDLRGSGESGGRFGTYGALETDDLHRWIAWMRRDTAPDACVYEFGVSLGASLALGAANAPGLCAVVAQSGFASLREMAFDRIGQQVHVGPWAGRTLLRPGVEFAFLYARIRRAVNVNGLAAIDAVARQGAPILVIHGTDDDNVPPRHALMLQAANPARVSLWLVPGATHDSLRAVAGTAFPMRVMDFYAGHRRVQP